MSQSVVVALVGRRNSLRRAQLKLRSSSLPDGLTIGRERECEVRSSEIDLVRGLYSVVRFGDHLQSVEQVTSRVVTERERWWCS